MKLLICGAGSIARELLKQLGDDWEVTLVDKSSEELEKTASIFPDIINTHVEDASSAAVMEKLDAGSYDYVLALTADDKVNSVIAELAAKYGVNHISAFIKDAEIAAALRHEGTHVIRMSSLAAGQLYHYLQDPRMRVTPLGLGPANVMEVKVSDHPSVSGKRAGFLRRRGARLAAIFRGEKLIFPKTDTVISDEDRLVIIGDTSIFQTVCGILECGLPRFPLAYGSGILVALRDSEKREGVAPEATEALYLAQNIHIKHVTLLNAEPEDRYVEHIATWPDNLNVAMESAEGTIPEIIRSECRRGSYGMVVTKVFEKKLLKSFGRPDYVRLSNEIDRPLLISRGTVPYEKFLVPFNGSAMAELAVDTAVDISKQMGGEITIAIIEQPDFITGDGTSEWKDRVLARVNELSHVHKVRFDVVTGKGNPVKEIAAMSSDFGLMIVGSNNRDRGLLSPNVGENIAASAECSVLLMAF
jgi:Trk K+ transport system NAD-binding subunit/nucleotide-binding universal stress UspA family protein